MDIQIISAIITAAATIIAVFISHWLLMGRKQLPGEAIEGEKEQRTVAIAAIDKDFIVGVALTLALAVIFGLSHVLGKYIITSASENPLLVITGRNLVSGLFILLFSWVLRHFYREKKENILYSIDSIFMIIGRSGSSLFYFFTFLFLTATATITLYKLNTIFTFLLLLFLVTRALPRISVANILIGIAVAIAGSIVTVGGFGSTASATSATEALGVMFALLAGLFWSVYIVFSERYSAKQAQQSSLAQRQYYVAHIYLYSTIPLVTLLLIAPFFLPPEYSIFSITLEGAFGVVVLGCISGVIGILYFEALKRISSLLVGVIVTLEIFFTMIFENIFLGQNIGWNLFVGAILVILGSISVGRESSKLRLNNNVNA